MSIQFPPDFPAPVAVQTGSGPAAATLSGLMMAPAALTPLAPPASGQSAPASPLREAGSAADIRQTRFAERRNALVDRLQHGDTSAGSGTGALWQAEQRRTCISVLATVVAAVAAK